MRCLLSPESGMDVPDRCPVSSKLNHSVLISRERVMFRETDYGCLSHFS
jgi:hypothetical protein